MRGGPLVASFPVEIDDQIMLATSRGQSIRVPVEGISFRSRSAGGVRVFNTGDGEQVVSVAWIADQGDEDIDAALDTDGQTPDGAAGGDGENDEI
jgi:DNA gyrase subunit A